ncbi:MAG: serine protease [Isosphaera sp.]|nr:serine protease [Isosphaera sp.]
MLTGAQLEEVTAALLSGYDRNSLRTMLRFRLDLVLDDLVDRGPFRQVVFDLLAAAERDRWVVDLIREAHRYNPRNENLLRAYQRYGAPPDVAAQQAGAAAAGGLEKTIKDRLPAFDFAVFREKMAEVEARVCRVEVGGNAAGTGFLVGPDAVLTNYHVLEAVLRGTAPAANVACRFDYKVLVDGSRAEGVTVGLRPTDWQLDASPYSPAETTRTPDNPPPTADQLDYALVRLARPVGDEPAAPKGGAGGPRRGWLPLPAAAPALVPKMPLMIAQHPDGKPLKLAVDTEAVIGVTAGGLRVRYATTTEAGSSGSPVFDLDWNLVALHHLGDPAYDHPPAYNQGVPIDKVRARVAAAGKAAALGG